MNGSATFEKIQIKEVTSHFRNGWIFFVVYPKISNQNSNGAISAGSIVNNQKIKPLILEKVVVKAKKAKEKELTSEMCEGEDNQNYQQEETQQEESVK